MTRAPTPHPSRVLTLSPSPPSGPHPLSPSPFGRGGTKGRASSPLSAWRRGGQGVRTREGIKGVKTERAAHARAKGLLLNGGTLGMVRGSRVGTLSATLGANERLQHECGDQQHEPHGQARYPMHGETHSHRSFTPLPQP